MNQRIHTVFCSIYKYDQYDKNVHIGLFCVYKRRFKVILEHILLKLDGDI